MDNGYLMMSILFNRKLIKQGIFIAWILNNQSEGRGTASGSAQHEVVVGVHCRCQVLLPPTINQYLLLGRTLKITSLISLTPL